MKQCGMNKMKMFLNKMRGINSSIELQTNKSNRGQ